MEPTPEPEQTPVTLPALRAIAARHGLRAPGRVPRGWAGATSRVYPLGEAVLKVPHAHPNAVAAARTDALVAGAARRAGVATPRLLALNEACDILPVPYGLHERIRGGTLAARRGSPAADGPWHAVGRDLALLHAGVARAGALAGLPAFAQSPETDPRPWASELAGEGLLPAATGRWLGDLLDALAPAALAEIPQVFCHGDVNAANVLVRAAAGGAAAGRILAHPVSASPAGSAAALEYLALIDWGGAGWIDPAWDFSGAPLSAVPAMLVGYRSVAPLAGDATAASRILWCHVQVGLNGLRVGRAGARSDPDGRRRDERRLARLLRHARMFEADVLPA